jgi:hypothetical protein
LKYLKEAGKSSMQLPGLELEGALFEVAKELPMRADPMPSSSGETNRMREDLAVKVMSGQERFRSLRKVLTRKKKEPSTHQPNSDN